MNTQPIPKSVSRSRWPFSFGGNMLPEPWYMDVPSTWSTIKSTNYGSKISWDDTIDILAQAAVNTMSGLAYPTGHQDNPIYNTRTWEVGNVKLTITPIWYFMLHSFGGLATAAMINEWANKYDPIEAETEFTEWTNDWTFTVGTGRIKRLV